MKIRLWTTKRQCQRAQYSEKVSFECFKNQPLYLQKRIYMIYIDISGCALDRFTRLASTAPLLPEFDIAPNVGVELIQDGHVKVWTFEKNPAGPATRISA